MPGTAEEATRQRRMSMARAAPRFHDFVGQKPTVDMLRRQLQGALARGEPFPHSLFQGPSGVGKSLLAGAMATEYGTAVVAAMGYVTRPDLAAKLATLKQGDFLLI